MKAITWEKDAQIWNSWKLTLEQVYTMSVIQFQFSKEYFLLSSVASCRKYINGDISCISKCLEPPQSPHLPGSSSSVVAIRGLLPYEYLSTQRSNNHTKIGNQKKGQKLREYLRLTETKLTIQHGKTKNIKILEVDS